MAMNRLPDDTRRQLSSVSIPSPDSLVKELVDNAIDAQATSIEVLVSANTIDRIEIRDNGTGIHPDDYQCLGCAGYTSKLRNFEELDVASGMTLGFRGEALASVRSLAIVVITTRRSDEPVATRLEVDSAKGGISSQKPTSAPVGTTVCATRLFGQLEVRAKCAVKDSVKIMTRIKELLIAYAMARPSLRLVLKVIGNPKASWAYSPKPGATAREAVLQLFGADTLATCCEKHSERVVGDGAEGQYSLEAHMLSPALTSSASTMPKRPYISVDGRPVVNYKGTMKKLIAIYKRHLTNMADSFPEFKTVDYFMRLNICCPTGSYDANIEPSKDNVIFVHEHLVSRSTQECC
ncbi:DNA mismatch repair protein PMS1 [Microdochium nivale]|nr:DNA mismatch repair protein PMS1 [Microdochium nivale]